MGLCLSEAAANKNRAVLVQGDSVSAAASVLCGRDDLLIGGRGADRLIGSGEDDILIGGFTAYGCDHEALS